MPGAATAVLCLASVSTKGIRLNLGVFFGVTGSLFVWLVAGGLAAGAIRAFHEAICGTTERRASDLAKTPGLTTTDRYRLSDLGYQETLSVSEGDARTSGSALIPFSAAAYFCR